jgi:hypothetical protein
MRRLVPAATVVLLAAACSSSAKPAAAPSPGVAATMTVPAAAKPTTAGHSSSPSSSPSPAAALPSLATLRSALLTAAELGPNFTAAPDDGSSGGAASGCKPLADLLNEPPGSANHVSGNYQGGAEGPFVGLELTAGTTSVLQSAYDSAKAAFDSCGHITMASGGAKVAFTLTPMQASGANTIEDRMDGSVQGVQVNGYIVLDLLPSAILTFDQMQIGSGSSQLAFALHAKALAKAQQKLGN